MKLTLSWLKTYLKTEATLDQIAERLTMIGLEVEAVIDKGEGLKDFSVAHVLDAVQHPNADKLKLCRVQTIQGEKQIVCGAPNARTGLVGIFAPVGTYVPGIDITLTQAEIRGIKSEGMLCSERELEISNEHDGIIDLADPLPVGTAAAEALGLDDPLIDINITPDRGDCLGVKGIARYLAASGLGEFIEPAPISVPGTFKSPVTVELQFSPEQKQACPAFAGRFIRSVKNGESPDWLKNRLKSIGLKPISTLVDITNFFTHDQARPLHVYDADKLSGNSIIVRMAQTGESFDALDNRNYTAHENDCVIADHNNMLAFGGVIGGVATGCSDDTVNVFLESAWFDPLNTAKTGRRHGIISDARARFERCVDPSSIIKGCDAAAQMIVELCGGEISEPVFSGQIPDFDHLIIFPFSEVKRLTGLELEPAEIRHYLRRIGFSITNEAKGLRLVPPTWRPDIETKADVVEEIVRMVGLDELNETPLPKANRIHDILPLHHERARIARRILTGRGFLEAITWSFIAKEDAKRFGAALDQLSLVNPLSRDKAVMRPSLLPGLLHGLNRNQRQGLKHIALCEIGQIFLGNKPEDQHIEVVAIRQGMARFNTQGRDWRQAHHLVDLYDAKADLAHLVYELTGLQDIPISRDAPDHFHPARSGTLRLGPNVLGHFGELHPGLLEIFDIKGPVVLFTLDLHALPKPKQGKGKTKPQLKKQRFMPITRDFAFIVDKRLEAATLIKAIRKADKKLISQIRVFDTFSGKHLGENEKSIALEVTLNQGDCALDDKAIDAFQDAVIAEAEKACGARIRI